jgi:ABC-type nitrate/sulfonate/bicarbonate transport system substrate-binding protein
LVETGQFKKVLGDVSPDAHHFDAGPAVMEALSAGQIDLAYLKDHLN